MSLVITLELWMIKNISRNCSTLSGDSVRIYLDPEYSPTCLRSSCVLVAAFSASNDFHESQLPAVLGGQAHRRCAAAFLEEEESLGCKYSRIYKIPRHD